MKKITSFIFLLVLIAACNPEPFPPIEGTSTSRAKREGISGLGYQKVLVLYLEGYNNLSIDIAKNIEQVSSGYIPRKHDKSALLIYQHRAKTRVDYKTDTPPVLCHVYKNYDKVIMDTLTVYPADQIALTPQRVNTVLNQIKKDFPSDSYGLLFSSHATGWIPPGYDMNSENGFEFLNSASSESNTLDEESHNTSPSSIGAEYDGSHTNEITLDVDEFAEAIPMRLDYILFDCCLMGGVETNYSLKDKTKYIVAAPTEILSEGFNYTTLCERLLSDGDYDLRAVCDDYYSKYSNGSSATIALYDCSHMQKLADYCNSIFPKFDVFSIIKDELQSYNYSFDYHYDFKDIIAKMGASVAELAEIEKILSELVVYKLATPAFIGTPINSETYSGMSMYLPRTSRPKLNELYKQTLWNKATGLLK